MAGIERFAGMRSVAHRVGPDAETGGTTVVIERRDLDGTGIPSG